MKQSLNKTAVVSLLVIISGAVPASLPVLAKLTPKSPSPTLPPLPATTVTGKVYLPTSPALNASADCSRIAVTLVRITTQKKPPSSTVFNLPNQQPVQANNATGDIKRGYCDYKLEISGYTVINNLYLGASAKYSDLWNPRASSVVESEPKGWTNPISNFEGNLDMTLKVTVIH